MKQPVIFQLKLVLIVLILFSLFSCRKDYFNNINAVEASGEWGIPLINSQMYIKDMISSFSGANVDNDDETGLLKFSLFMDSTQLIRPTDLLSIPNHTYTNNFTFPAPVGDYTPHTNVYQMTFQSDLLEQDHFIIEEGVVKRGTMEITMNTNIDQPEYTIIFSTPNLYNANNQQFAVVFTPSSLTQTIDLAGYKFVILPSDPVNTITFTTTIRIENIVSTTLTDYFVDGNIALQSLFFKYMTGKMPPKSYPVRFENPISIFSANLSGDFKLLQPKYSIKVGNSIASFCKFITDSVGFQGNNLFSSVIDPGTEILCNASPGNGHFETTLNEGYGHELQISNAIEAFLFDGDAIINPGGLSAGSITIDELSSLYVTSKIEVLLESKFNYVEYRDTLDFDIDDNDFTQIIEEAVFRLALTNGIPLYGNSQIYFYNSDNGNYVDSLFSNVELFKPAIVGSAPDYKVIAPYVSPVKYITFDSSRFKKLRDVDKLILRYKLYSKDPDAIIRIYEDQKLDLRLGVKIKYNTNSLEL